MDIKVSVKDAYFYNYINEIDEFIWICRIFFFTVSSFFTVEASCHGPTFQTKSDQLQSSTLELVTLLQGRMLLEPWIFPLVTYQTSKWARPGWEHVFTVFILTL